MGTEISWHSKNIHLSDNVIHHMTNINSWFKNIKRWKDGAGGIKQEDAEGSRRMPPCGLITVCRCAHTSPGLWTMEIPKQPLQLLLVSQGDNLKQWSQRQPSWREAAKAERRGFIPCVHTNSSWVTGINMKGVGGKGNTDTKTENYKQQGCSPRLATSQLPNAVRSSLLYMGDSKQHKDQKAP